MTAILTILSAILLLAGSFFFFAGSIGIIRLPDFFCRLHATTKCDTLGQTCILVGIALFEGVSLISVKILAISIFFLISSPTAAQSLAKGAYWAGIIPENLDEQDEYQKRLEEIQ